MSLDSFANKDSFAHEFWLICKQVISHLQTIKSRLPTRVPTRATPRGCLRDLLIQWNWTINKWLFTPRFLPSDCWDNWLALLFNTPFLSSDCWDNILALLFNTRFLPSDCWDNWLVLPPVQLYGAPAIIPRMTAYKQHGTHLWCWRGCACDLVAMALQEQWFWGNVSGKSKIQKNQGRISGPPPCPTVWCIGNIDQNHGPQTAWHSSVMLRRLCLWSGGNEDERTVVLGRCQLEVKNAEKSRKNQWSSSRSNCMVHRQYHPEWQPTNGMALTCDAEEAVPVIWWQWWCKKSGFGAMSVGTQKFRKIKEESVVFPPVQLYGASAILPRTLPYKRHGTHLWCFRGCACDLVAMMMRKQQFWGDVSWKSKMQKNQGRISGPPPCPTVWCISNITQNDGLQTACHSPVIMRRLCLWSGGNGAARAAVLGRCQSEIKNAKKSRKNWWFSPLSNCMVHQQYYPESRPTNSMVLTCNAEEAVPVIWWQWWCENSGFGAMSVRTEKCRKIKEESVVFPPVPLWCIGNITQNDALQTAWHSPVIVVRWSLWYYLWDWKFTYLEVH